MKICSRNLVQNLIKIQNLVDLKNQNLHHGEQKGRHKCWSFETSCVFFNFLYACTTGKTKNLLYLSIIYVVDWNFGKEHKYANA